GLQAPGLEARGPRPLLIEDSTPPEAVCSICCLRHPPRESEERRARDSAENELSVLDTVPASMTASAAGSIRNISRQRPFSLPSTSLTTTTAMSKSLAVRVPQKNPP